MPSRALLDQVAEAFNAKDIPRLVQLYHPDALISNSRTPDVPLTRDATFANPDVLRNVHVIGPLEVLPIDERAGILRATARVQSDHGALTKANHVWLLSFVDGLVYRQRIVDSREAAEALYAANGLELGLTRSAVGVDGRSGP